MFRCCLRVGEWDTAPRYIILKSVFLLCSDVHGLHPHGAPGQEGEPEQSGEGAGAGEGHGEHQRPARPRPQEEGEEMLLRRRFCPQHSAETELCAFEVVSHCRYECVELQHSRL